MKSLRALFRRFLKASPLAHLYCYRYQYNFSPSQLTLLLNGLEKSSKLSGNFAEFGCAFGATTVVLNKHLDELGVTDRSYFCVDTFSGFDPSDIEVEVLERGKVKQDYMYAFRENSKALFDYTLSLNDVKRVKSFCCDVKLFDFTECGRLSFCLIDLDLYSPTLHTLGRVYDLMLPGGLIFIDDCVDNNRFDGAYSAYFEFCKSKCIEPKIVGKKIGLVSVP